MRWSSLKDLHSRGSFQKLLEFDQFLSLAPYWDRLCHLPFAEAHKRWANQGYLPRLKALCTDRTITYTLLDFSFRSQPLVVFLTFFFLSTNNISGLISDIIQQRRLYKTRMDRNPLCGSSKRAYLNLASVSPSEWSVGTCLIDCSSYPLSHQ